ncbi:Mbov_0395 family pilin-like conjugal transfer protein [Mycoplasma zalophidermidis]|uniref:Mbov_0395 family pilin-like conjugal transfer protein n=1 Tax=Mycoplasma zalophidermidis TaxID=398174 RepID=UPI001FF0010E|nr:hypothetical protein [Mycoplasma zalophidermidis]MCR8966564.1 hypothetical protein [Mycoplasma zalophidermidis]
MNLLNKVLDGSTSTGGNQGIKESFDAIATQIQYYINIVLGAFAGVLTIVIVIIAAIAFFKAGKTESEEERQGQMRRIKWLGIFLIAVVVLWALSPIITSIIKSAIGA